MRRSLAPLLALAACHCPAAEPPGPAAPPDVQVEARTLDRVSFVCLQDDGALRAGFATGCLSSTCSRVTSVACTAARAGDVVTVTGHASFERWDDGACAADCGAAFTVCDGVRLDDPAGVRVSTGAKERPVERCWKAPVRAE